MKLRPQHPAVPGHQKLHALRQPVHVGLERAQLIAQGLRQHGDDAVHQVGGVAPPLRLRIQRRARLDVMRHVRDVHPQPPLVRRHPLQADRIVKVLRVIRINGDHVMRTAIQPVRQVLGMDRRADGLRLVQHRLGKVQRQIILAQHRQHVHPLRIRRAQDFHDFALGMGVARFPFPQFDHHLVPDARGPAHVPGRRHIQVMRHPGIVGDDVKRGAALLQRAHDPRAFALEDADDRAGFRGVGAEAFPPNIPAHQNPILMQRRAGGAFGDAYFLQAPIVRLEKSLARAIHADAAGNEIRVAGADVAAGLDLHDLALPFQPAQRPLKLRLAVRRHAQMAA